VTARVPRILLLAAAIVIMGYGIWLGLLRLGWILPLPWPDQLILHGPLMIGGFLGTVIGLERAIGSAKRWVYLAPVCSAGGGLALVFGPSPTTGAFLMAAASLIVVLLFVVLLRQQFSTSTFALLVGALCWCVGNIQWMGGAGVYRVVFWWVAFVVLTVAAERLELTRVRRPSSSVRMAFGAAATITVAGAISLAGGADVGKSVLGIGLLTCAAWFVTCDVARRTVRQPGLTRYIAVCLLTGYVWLGVAGGLLLATEATVPGLTYDAALHSVFVGFTVSLIFGHAPIVFPAVLHRPVPYRRLFYLPVVLLHASMVMRLAGDLVDELGRLRAWGGLWSAVAIGLFFAITAGTLGPVKGPSPSSSARDRIPKAS
jgi:hypothetical protein